MWSIEEQRHILPDLEVATNVINKLNANFDSRDMYHHSSADKEMFEFSYSLDSSKREAWEITFLGRCVANGGGNVYSKNYDDCYEYDYIFITPENENKIYEMAYNGAIGVITDLINLMSYADIDEKHKKNWILTLGKNIKTN